MPKTISFHNGTAWSRGHNVRDERYTSKQEHIDPTLTSNNVTLRDVPVRQAYDEIFGSAVAEYNEKQKRADRRITDYYDKIKQDKRKHPVYECIVQIGDRSDTGHTAELEKQALQRFAEEWDKRNPNLRLIGAYIHCDEPDGTVHMHLDYIPVAECTRGMRLQNSLDRALQQQGFHSENIHQTAQIAWQDSEREALCVICRDLGIDAQRNQDIGQGRKSLTPQEYRRAKEEQQAQIEDELKPIKEELDSYKELKIKADDIDIQGKTVPLTGKTLVDTNVLNRLKRQAKAYTANRDDIDNRREKEKLYERDVERLNVRESELRRREQDLAQQQRQHRERIEREYAEIEKLYDKQSDLNAYTERVEQELSETRKEICTLKAENGSLRRSNAQQGETIRGAYESLTNVCKAVGMLKYDKEGEYQADLSPQQERLVDGIANYSAKWAIRDGFTDLAEEINRNVGISEGIQDEIDELTPKISRGRGGRGL